MPGARPGQGSRKQVATMVWDFSEEVTFTNTRMLTRK